MIAPPGRESTARSPRGDPARAAPSGGGEVGGGCRPPPPGGPFPRCPCQALLRVPGSERAREGGFVPAEVDGPFVTVQRGQVTWPHPVSQILSEVMSHVLQPIANWSQIGAPNCPVFSVETQTGAHAQDGHPSVTTQKTETCLPWARDGTTGRGPQSSQAGCSSERQARGAPPGRG